jgi:3-oxoacyl-[acyl-carrier-protein] synthase III
MIKAIATYLPQQTLLNEELEAIFPDWPKDKIYAKTGIAARHISAPGEYSSDMAVSAAERLFATGLVQKEEIDFLIVTTQTPDHLIPTTACIVQHKLGLSKNVGAIDINLGCSAYVYALSVAESLVASRTAQNVLLITCDTYTKVLNANDKSVRTLFGDAATATLVQESPTGNTSKFVFGTDGGGAANLQIPAKLSSLLSANASSDGRCLQMNGPEILSFALQEVPRAVKRLLDSIGKPREEIDYFVFHQANEFMLKALTKKLDIPDSKAPRFLEDCGNTVSSSIPLVLYDLAIRGEFESEKQVVLVGFGVGYSWAASYTKVIVSSHQRIEAIAH